MFKNLLNRLLPASPGKSPLSAVAAGSTPEALAEADALIAEGNEREDAGAPQEAEALYRSAVVKAPRHARAHLNLGIVLASRGDDGGAERAYEAALAVDPQHAFANYNFARLVLVRGDFVRAEGLVREALRVKPDFPQALVVLASALDALDRREQAADALQAALRLQPDDAGAWFNLAALLIKLKRSDEAEAAAKRVLEIVPGHASSLGMLSLLTRDHLFVPEVLVHLRAAIRTDPENLTYQSQELLLLNFDDEIDAEEMFRRHVEFGRRTEQAIPMRFDHFPGRDEPGRRLRLGYVSGDFNLHPAMFFFMPVLEHRDRRAFEVFCYSTAQSADHITQRVREQTDHWVDAHAMTDVQLADAIHADAIDILVDLTGHTTVPRLGVFSQRPAPVQVSWVGYLNTTGLTRMDYRLTDRRCDPLEASQPLHTERLKFLPDSQWCYRPFIESSVDPVAPHERNGYLTFGSFNDALKLTVAMCRRWGELLSRVPHSRLIIAAVGSQRKRDAIRAILTSCGIAADRYEFVPRVSLDKFPQLIGSVDIALDTFPYGGGTTTFDALWMGVPVVATVGSTPVSRSAASILAVLELDDWVAPSIDDWVDTAVARAADPRAIVALRQALRPRMQASPLTDVDRFVRRLEAAYREMWAERTH